MVTKWYQLQTKTKNLTEVCVIHFGDLFLFFRYVDLPIFKNIFGFAVRKNFCFYLDIQDHGLARSISRRIQDMGLVSRFCALPPK